MNQSSTPHQLLQVAITYHRNSQFAEAEKCYLALLEIQPVHSEALGGLGALYQQTERYTLAIQYYQKALKIAPKNWDIQLNLGSAYLELNRFEEAADCYRPVLQAFPENDEIKNALGYALQSLGEACQKAGHYLQAEACYQETLKLSPNDSALHYNLGNAQRELGKLQHALSSYQKAAKINPQDADIYNNLGNVLRELGYLDEAIHHYQTALKLNPDLFHAKVHLVHQKQHACDWHGLEADVSQIRGWVINQPKAQISPFAFLAMPNTTADEQKKCAENWLNNRYSHLILNDRNKFSLVKKEHDKLRIGYLSGDFRLHPLASLITELIELHDRNAVEVFAYSYGHDDKTPERKRLEHAFDHFIDIKACSLEDAAKRIHTDNIDILVDLSGFTQTSRTGIVALRSAPVSVSWLGFPGTMGRSGDTLLFDYLLTDSIITPLEQQNHYAETLAYLPHSYQPNDSKRSVAKYPTRTDCALPKNAFVFCCFNQSFKILPGIFDIWMRLLHNTPNSVLWLLDSNAPAKKHLLQAAKIRDIEENRLVFAPRVPMPEHLARHVVADLFLDTLPYNAHTTTSDALWMGLPVLTCMGETFASRVACSLLKAANLPEMVTQSLAEYEARALHLAHHPVDLSLIKQKLTINKSELALFNTPQFAKNLENLYQQMWQVYLANLPLKPLEVMIK